LIRREEVALLLRATAVYIANRTCVVVRIGVIREGCDSRYLRVQRARYFLACCWLRESSVASVVDSILVTYYLLDVCYWSHIGIILLISLSHTFLSKQELRGIHFGFEC